MITFHLHATSFILGFYSGALLIVVFNLFCFWSDRQNWVGVWGRKTKESV